jgi:hypothetical protein
MLTGESASEARRAEPRAYRDEVISTENAQSFAAAMVKDAAIEFVLFE